MILVVFVSSLFLLTSLSAQTGLIRRLNRFVQQLEPVHLRYLLLIKPNLEKARLFCVADEIILCKNYYKGRNAMKPPPDAVGGGENGPRRYKQGRQSGK